MNLSAMHPLHHRQKSTLTLLACWLFAVSAPAVAADNSASCGSRQYVFSWNLQDRCLPAPRGGTTQGAPVVLDHSPSSRWQALQQSNLNALERDRRAILAMTGGYRANFEFVETFGYQPGFSPAAPYQSWGTEYIYVLEEKADFISLQHIMVMFFETEDGNIQGPMVMKHWRQDWQFEPRQLLEYQGQQTWRLRPLDAQERRGRWGQTVYQVDDSPRYASLGQWQHEPGYSQWESGRTWRPLPRRESSVRDDYQVLEGINRHIILPDGWVQEEANRKLRLAPDGKPQAYVARELGNNRYQRVRDFDFRAGDRYLRETADFWKQVRVEWSRLIKRHRGLHLRQEVDGVALFSALFELAERYRQESKDATAAQQEIQQILQRYSSKPA